MIGRLKRVQEMLKREIAVILQERINDPRVRDLTVTRVEVSRDLKLAKVFYMVPASKDQRQQVKTGANKASGFIRSELAGRVSMKFIPKISFREDLSDKRKEAIADIFAKIKEEQKD